MKRLPYPAFLLLWLFASPLAAQPQLQTAFEGLANPGGLAIQPGSGHVFVEERGAGRIVRLVGEEIQEVINGFAHEGQGDAPRDAGRLGLAFLNTSNLVVCGGSAAEGKPRLGVYKIPRAGAAAITADGLQANREFAEAEVSRQGMFGVALLNGTIFATCCGANGQGWIVSAAMQKEDLTTLTPFQAAAAEQALGAPRAITATPKYGYLVIGQQGSKADSREMLVSFFQPDTRRLLLSLPSGMQEISGLAYSPETGLLYATGFSIDAPNQGGLFRLDASRAEGRQVISRKKIVDLEGPRCLAFADDGTLYLSVAGTAAEGDGKKPGKILKIAPSL